MSRQERSQSINQQESSTAILKPDASECMDLLASWHQSLLGFYFGRVQQYWNLPFAIQPFSPQQEYIELYERFMEKMVADYAEQAEKLVEIANGDLQFSHDPSEYAAHLLKAQEDAGKIIDQAKAQAEHIIAAAEARADQTAAEPEPQAVTPRRRKSA